MIKRFIVTMIMLSGVFCQAAGLGFRLSESNISLASSSQPFQYPQHKDYFTHVFVGQKFDVPKTNLMVSFAVDYAQKGMEEIFGKNHNRPDEFHIKNYVSLDIMPTFKVSESTRIFALLGYGYNHAVMDALIMADDINMSQRNSIQSMRMGVGFEAMINQKFSLIGRFVDAQYRDNDYNKNDCRYVISGKSRDLSLGIMIYA